MTQILNIYPPSNQLLWQQKSIHENPPLGLGMGSMSFRSHGHYIVRKDEIYLGGFNTSQCRHMFAHNLYIIHICISYLIILLEIRMIISYKYRMLPYKCFTYFFMLSRLEKYSVRLIYYYNP